MTSLSAGPKSKRSIYFPQEMIEEIKAEADRQGRSFSWVVQQAWFISRGKLKQLPSAPSHHEEDR